MKIRLLLLFFLCILYRTIPAQSLGITLADSGQSYEVLVAEGTSVVAPETTVVVDRMPTLVGVQPSIAKWLAYRVDYPDLAVDYAVEGAVIVKYRVHPDGRMTDVRIVRKLGFGCDEAVLAALKELPRFQPALVDGRPVATWCLTPVVFRLE
jgi:protein TonB